MSQVVTELVIDADTSGANQFSDAMDKAGASADSGMSSVAGMSLAIAGVGAASVAVLAGLRSFVDYVGQQSQQLVDLSDHAASAGVSVKELQEILFAARSAGVSDKDFFSGIDKISDDLVQANQGATESWIPLFEGRRRPVRRAKAGRGGSRRRDPVLDYQPDLLGDGFGMAASLA